MNSPALFAPTRKSRLAATVGISAVLAITLTATGSGAAHAAEATVGLGVATSYGVLAYTKIENTGLTVIDADIALSPTDASFITGLNSPVVPTDGLVLGRQDAANPEAAAVKAEVLNAYTDAASRASTANIGTELGGQTLVPGVYDGAALELAAGSTLTLDGAGVYIIRATSSLVTFSDSQIVLTNGADACNIFWRVPQSATIGSGTDFAGTILANTAITVQDDATIQGRLFALNAEVTLINDDISAGNCPVVASTPIPVVDDDDDDDDADDNGNNGGGGGGAGGDDSTAGGAQLAATGDEHTLQIALALTALAGGAALLIVGNRRRTGVQHARHDGGARH